MTGPNEPTVQRMLEPERILAARRLVQTIYADERIKEYVLDLVAATRRPGEAGLGELAPMVEFGASPRAAIFLLRAKMPSIVMWGYMAASVLVFIAYFPFRIIPG